MTDLEICIHQTAIAAEVERQVLKMRGDTEAADTIGSLMHLVFSMLQMGKALQSENEEMRRVVNEVKLSERARMLESVMDASRLN